MKDLLELIAKVVLEFFCYVLFIMLIYLLFDLMNNVLPIV